MGSACLRYKNGLPDLSEALLSCRTVNQKDASHMYTFCVWEKKKKSVSIMITHLQSLTLMMASVWMYSMSELRRPSSLPPRWVVLTIPVVTVFWRENGLPIATTNSPGLRSDERPSNSTGSFVCKWEYWYYFRPQLLRKKKRMSREALQAKTVTYTGEWEEIHKSNNL